MNQSKATDILFDIDPSLVRYALRHMNHEASPAMLMCEADLLLGTCEIKTRFSLLLAWR